MIDARVMCADPACGERLDPILVAAGHKVHFLCTEPGENLKPDPFGTTEQIGRTEQIVDQVQQVLIGYARGGVERSRQVAIGPSEIGHPCRRHLAYKLLDWPRWNPGGDPLPSLVGTGAHTVMAKAFLWANEQLGRERYIVERKLEIRPGLEGSGDCFDTDTGTVLDWKFPGTTSMREYRAGQIGDTYRIQLHAYGLGWERAGFKVAEVADVFLPRGGNLLGKYGACAIREPYDPQVALAALDNLDAVLISAAALDVEAHPERWALIPATPDHCGWCPWYRPKSQDLATGCPGDSL